MKVLFVENITPPERGGDQDKWRKETEEAFGLAAYDDFDLIIGLDENGDCPVLSDRTGMGQIEVTVVMARGD